MNGKTILGSIAKNFLALFLVLVMLITAFPLAAQINVDAAEADVADTSAQITSGSGTWISGKLTYTYSVDSDGTSGNGAAGTVSASGGTLTVTATNSKEVSGCSTTAAEATTTSVTVKNASSYPLLIKTLTPNTATVGGVAQGDTIAPNATFTVTVTAPAKSSSTKVTGTVEIEVKEQTSVNITLKPSPYVSYTVNGKNVAQNGSDQTFTVDAGTNISLPTVTAPSGYEFKGWRIGSELKQNINSFKADAGYDVFPVIVAKGTDINAANFKVGSNTYTFWEDAVTAAVAGGGLIIVNAENVSLPNNTLDNLLPAAGGSYVKPVSGGGVEYILPASVRLLVPYTNSTTFHTTEPKYTKDSFTTPTAYRTLTVPGGVKLNISGAICVDSAVMCVQPLCAVPYGPHGKIEMKSGSEMTLNSGANLYCYGYINGDGEVNAKNGSEVYELMQITSWRGGTAVSGMRNNNQKVFPVNQYYVQNIEAPMNIYKGATEYLWSCGYAGGICPVTTPICFIGQGGMFELTGGNNDYITKRYHANVDRTEVAINGNMTISKLSLSIDGGFMNVDMDSDDYVLPINNMQVTVCSGTTSISSTQTNGVAILPGSQITVSENATFNANAPVFFYDSAEWVGKSYSYNATGQSQDLSVCRYSTANGTTAIRTVENMKDAKLDVNGTFNVTGKGYLYTTESGANITSSEGTGKIQFQVNAATKTATTYQGTQSGTDMTYHEITCNNAWLLNGDGEYSETVSTGQSTWKYDKDGEHWYRYLVDFKYNDKLISRGYYCENNDIVDYDAGWLTDLDASATSGNATVKLVGSAINVSAVTSDTVVTMTGTPAEYIPTFVLSEKEYEHYKLYNSGTLDETVEFYGETFHIVKQASSALPVGAEYAKPTDESMGISDENHNTITWNMTGYSATSGDPYRGTVPVGETPGGPVYIFGFYTGKVAHNSWNDQYYPTLIEAFEVLPQDVSATITLLADCGTYEEELSTQAYTSYDDNNIILDLNGHHAVGHILNRGIFTLELNGGSFEYITGATAEAAAYKGVAAVLNSGTMTIQDSVGGGKITADAIGSSSLTNYASVIRNNAGANLTVDGITLEHVETVNNYCTALLNYGTANVDNAVLTSARGITLANSTASANLSIKNSDVNITTTSGAYSLYNNLSAKAEIDNCNLSTLDTYVIYNLDGGEITSLKDSDITIAAPITVNRYAVFNYGGKITTIDNCDITGNSGINNRNKRGSSTLANGYNIAYYGTIGTIKDSRVNVGMYAVYNGGTIDTMTGSTFTAAPASAQVPWPTGTAALNGNSVHAYTIVNSNLWWYDSAVWKRTDTTVKNGDTNMLQRRVDQYKTEDEYKPTIGTITDCEIKSFNTSTSNSYGYYALQNLGVINTINGSTEITAAKHPDNAKTVYGYYALSNSSGGKIGSIGSDVTINAYNYALTNSGARYAQTDTTYSTTYLESGKLKSGGLATDYDYTYADVSEIGSTAATISSTSQYAVLNYSKIGSITGAVSANYNVIVNAGAATTTTVIEGTTANSRAIEHRRFTDDDASLAANEIGRDFEYTRNTTDGCYIGEITGTVTATGAGYQAIYNYGHIGTLGGTVTTPTGKAAKDSNYYPLIFNGDQRQASLKQTEDYYVESNDYGATKYLREYTFDVPTIDTISCTATNPQDYTIRNLGVINTLSGNISGKTITVANEASGTFHTRKTITYYSSASLLAATKASTEVTYEYTKQPAEIKNITNAKIDATSTVNALRNYGKIGTISGSSIIATTTPAITNASSTITEYTSNRLTALTGCVPSKDACALNYDIEQTINEDEIRESAVIDCIGAGNYIRGTTNAIINNATINTIDSGEGKTSIIYASARQAIYNYDGNYSRRTNTDAVLTNATGTLTNNYTYEYAPAYIGTIKNVFILGVRQGILNGAGTATYVPVTIGEIGAGAEIRTTATSASYPAIHNASTYAKIEKITGGVFRTNGSSGYALNNASTTYPIYITGGDFLSVGGTRATAVYQPDKATRYTYPAGVKLSTDTETLTYHTLSNGELVDNTDNFYYIPKTYIVTFDKQGHGDDIDVQHIQKGGTATQPEAPAVGDIVTEGTAKFRFDGWFTDDTFATPFDFDSAINADTTVYAKWTQVYTVTWKNGEETIKTEDVASGETPAYDGETPTKAATAQYTYTFDGWAPTPEPIAMDTVYLAKFKQTVNEYTITWVDGNGDTLKTEKVAYGETPSYSGATPTKAETDDYTYTFNNTWSPEITSVTTDATYTAQFTEEHKANLTVTWKNYDGKILETDEKLAPGAALSYNGDTPTRAADAQYTYTFAGWSTDGKTVIDPMPSTVTENVEYIAVFNSTVNKYTVTWQNADGTVLETDSNVAYGTTPAYNGATPTKKGDAQYSYTFDGWSTDGSAVIDPLPDVSGNVTYKAVFTQTVNTYTVQWMIDDGPSDEELKTAVDALIAEVAQTIYNDAKTEGDFAWQMGWFSHEALVKMHLEAGRVGSDESSAYIAKRIIEIVDNNSADFSAADALWDSCKDTVASDFASFSGYTGQENGTVYSGLTPAQKSSMEALSGGKTILEIDKNVPYGTTPEYNGTTPTKEGSDGKTYIFTGWSDGTEFYSKDAALPTVTGDVTYTAVFREEEIFNQHSLTLDGTIGVNFYTILPEGYNADNTTMDFSWGNKYISTNTYSDTETYTDLGVSGKADGVYVKYTVHVAAKELNDEITAVLKDKTTGEVLATEKYRGTDYAYNMLDKIKNDPESVTLPAGKTVAQLKALITNTLIYSAKCQVNFAYHADKDEDLATYRLGTYLLGEVDASKLTGNTFEALPAGMSYYGGSLNLGSETSYMVIFRNNNKLQPTLSAYYDGDPEQTAIEVKGQYSGVAAGMNILNIPAARVTDDIILTLNDGSADYTATINSGAYIKTVLTGNYTPELREAITALYWYNQAAKNYFAKEN